MVLTAASGVTGVRPAIHSIGRLCAGREIVLIVDAAQSAGSIRLDVNDLPPRNMVALAGHKGLFGPAGTGALHVGPGFSPRELTPLIRGATGPDGQGPEPAGNIPQLFEAGAPNLPGFAGLAAGVAFALDLGVERIGRHKHDLVHATIPELRRVPGLKLHPAPQQDYASGLLALNASGWSSENLARVLRGSFGIVTQPGLHCAPLHHRALGAPEGSVRISVGWWNTELDLQKLVEALHKVARTRP